MVRVSPSWVKVKICGITRLDDALAVSGAGCDAIGFSFVRQSPRYITPLAARAIAGQLPAGIIKIGVFRNAREATIRRIATLCKLDMLQLHGDESPVFCRRLGKYKIIKVFRIKDTIDVDHIMKYDTFAYLFDTFVEGKPGGTGMQFDWRLINRIGRIKKTIFLSGGLDEHNVRQAILCVKPQWVDVCSSVETAPGKKDGVKVMKFIKAAKGTA